MSEPRFSVVITTYNRPVELRTCLEALARQDYPPDAFEVIVVDDGGSAPLEALVADYTGRICCKLLAQANRGPAAGRNSGAGAAAHDFLAFTDDDCEPDRGWLSGFARRLRQSPDVLVGGRTINGLPDNAYSVASQFIVDMVYAYYNRDPEDARFFTSNNFALRTELFRECGGFNERFRFSEDREFCHRWRHRGRLLIFEPAAIMRHSHRLSAIGFWRQHFGYGRGAACFHRTCAAGGTGRIADHVEFHLDLGRWWRSAAAGFGRRRSLALFARLALWQVANACGFLYESLRRQ